MISFKRLSDLSLAGKRVFIRSDLNVPQDEAGSITDDTRIRASAPAIAHCLKSGAAVMVTSHLGRPTEGQFDQAASLEPVGQRLSELLGVPVRLQRDWVDTSFGIAAGEVVLVTAAAGGTGHWAVQAAASAGAHVVAVAGGRAKAALCARLGAHRVVDHEREPLAAVLAREYANRLDVVYDGVGGGRDCSAPNVRLPADERVVWRQDVIWHGDGVLRPVGRGRNI